MNADRLVEYDDPSRVDPVAWAALRAKPPASLIGSLAWMEAAFATTDRDKAPLLLAAESSQGLMGLLPLALDRSGSRPVARPVGAPYDDLSDVLVLPGHERRAARSILSGLAALSQRGIAVELHSMDPDGVLARADAEVGTLSWTPERAAPTVSLDRDLEAVVSGRRRRTWGNRKRRLEKLHDVEFRRIDGEAAFEEVARFERLREARRAATGRPPERPPLAIVDAAVRKLAPSGAAVFMDMLVDGVPVARDLYLLDPPVGLMWLRGLSPEWQRFPCGHLLLCWTARGLRAEGFEVLDLGRGDEPYKFVFGASGRVLLRGSLPPAPHGAAGSRSS